MELRQLQYFIIVSQEQSISKAAKKAYVSQQAISKAIQSLESELGTELLIRHSHGVELTSYGHILLKKAYQISNSLNEISYDIHNAKNSIQNTVPLAISEGPAQWLDIKKMLAFQNTHLQYKVSIKIGNDKDIENDIISEKVELGIMGSKGTTSKLEFVTMSESATFLAVNKKNPLAEKPSVTISDLKNQNLIIGSDDFYGCNQVKTLCNTMGFSPHVQHEVHNLYISIKLLNCNEGVFLCPEQTASFFEGSDVRLIPIQNDPRLFSIQLAWKKNASLSSSAELLKKYILKKVKS